jgi:hypothetical protein
MSKRELGQLSGLNDTDAPRSKRRRDAAQAGAGTSSDVDIVHSDPIVPEDEDGVGIVSLKESSLELWQTVRDAVNKECVSIPCNPFRPAPFRSLALHMSFSHAHALFCTAAYSLLLLF